MIFSGQTGDRGKASQAGFAGEARGQKPEAGRLYVWMPGSDSPSGHAIEASVYDYGANVNARQHIRMENLHFFGHARSGVSGSGASVLHLDNCIIEWADGKGIDVGGDDIIISGCRVTGANEGGIGLNGTNCRIENNIIEKTGLLWRLNRRGLGGNCCTARGINFGGSACTVRGNTLDSTGYIGIGFGGTDHVIEHNVINHSCVTIDDGAGIYTWSSDYASPGSAGTIIRRNFIMNSVGSPDGAGSSQGWAHGIYLDDRTHDICLP